MPPARRGQPQRGADHLDHVRTPDQGAHRQQHMSAGASRTPRPPRPTPLRPAVAAQRPRSGMTPRTQPTRTVRARQQALRQPPLDLRNVFAYREHGASKRAQVALPAAPRKDDREGPPPTGRRTSSRCRRTPTPRPPPGRLTTPLTPADADLPPHGHQERRLTSGPCSHRGLHPVFRKNRQCHIRAFPENPLRDTSRPHDRFS